MASPVLVKVTMLVVMCTVMGIAMVDGAVSCGGVQMTVAPCIGYLRGPGGGIPAACCNGIRNLNNQIRATPDRQAACRCLKTTAISIPGLNLASLSALPAKCGVNLPFKPTLSIDCNKFNTHLQLLYHHSLL
ncbi:hypothetical protein VNO78_15514 [Psophocarpus tetragonolobus]|uniref:Non-specific lipid-transfer protein n=1 Tax=Psophocarpus tetragonolobus TaxID=3891 RepID=A0AAN9SIX6_PSOTE